MGFMEEPIKVLPQTAACYVLARPRSWHGRVRAKGKSAKKLICTTNLLMMMSSSYSVLVDDVRGPPSQNQDKVQRGFWGSGGLIDSPSHRSRKSGWVRRHALPWAARTDCSHGSSKKWGGSRRGSSSSSFPVSAALLCACPSSRQMRATLPNRRSLHATRAPKWLR